MSVNNAECIEELPIRDTTRFRQIAAVQRTYFLFCQTVAEN